MAKRVTRNRSTRLGRLGIAGAIAVFAATVLPAGAQIASPEAPGTPASTPAPAAAMTATPAAPAIAPRESTTAAPRPMLYYVCGGMDLDSQVRSPDPRHPFNLGVSFASAANAAPLSDVAVRVRRHGRVLMEFVAAGPHCLFSVPDAEYRVEATYRGDMKFEIVQTGRPNVPIQW